MDRRTSQERRRAYQELSDRYYQAVNENNADEVLAILPELFRTGNAYLESGYSPLVKAMEGFRIAAKNDSVALLNIFINPPPNTYENIDINRQQYGNTTLIEAINAGSLNAVEFLLDNGADPNIEDHFRGGALYNACKKNLLMVKLLQRKIPDLDMNMRTRKINQTLLMAACQGGTLDVVNYLLANNIGGKIDDVDMYGTSASFFALSYPEILETLIQHGINVNGPIMAKEEFKLASESNLLQEAVKKGNIKSVEILIENGANVNAVIADGFTPLMTSVINNDYDIVKLLLDSGADISLKSSRGVNALSIANAYDHTKVKNLLAERSRQIDKRGLVPDVETSDKRKTIGGRKKIIKRKISKRKLKRRSRRTKRIRY